jgi:RES domain
MVAERRPEGEDTGEGEARVERETGLECGTRLVGPAMLRKGGGQHEIWMGKISVGLDRPSKPRDRLSPNASIVMASFLHAAPTGLRFSGPELLGAWYASEAINTAIIEVSHHLRREAYRSGTPEMRGHQYRTYSATLDGAYEDIRGLQATRPALYAAADYSACQLFGEDIRRTGDGIVYDSVRHVGGVNVVAYRPRKIRNVTQRDHYELTVPLVGRIVVRRLAA